MRVSKNKDVKKEFQQKLFRKAIEIIKLNCKAFDWVCGGYGW